MELTISLDGDGRDRGTLRRRGTSRSARDEDGRGKSRRLHVG